MEFRQLQSSDGVGRDSNLASELEPSVDSEQLDLAGSELSKRGIQHIFDPEKRETFFAQQLDINARAALFLLIEMGMAITGEVLGTGTIGNEAADDIAAATSDELIEMALVFTFMIPPVEEFLCRGIPNWTLDAVDRMKGWLQPKTSPDRLPSSEAGEEHTEMRWVAGALSSLLFAAIHNLTDDMSVAGLELAEDLKFSYESFPLPQFVLGLFMWNIARKFGVKQAIATHVIHNAIAMSMILGFDQLGAGE